MSNASNLEKTIGGWFKNVPHLPKAGREWLAENIWWLSLIGAILSVLLLLALVPIFFAALAVTSVASSLTMGYSMAAATYPGLYWLSTLISIVSYIFTTILLIMAINPLKAKAKKGWNLLFWSYLVSFAFAVVGDLVRVDVFAIVSAVISAAVSGYFLFEIHSYFGAKYKEHVEHHAKAAKK